MEGFDGCCEEGSDLPHNPQVSEPRLRRRERYLRQSEWAVTLPLTWCRIDEMLTPLLKFEDLNSFKSVEREG